MCFISQVKRIGQTFQFRVVLLDLIQLCKTFCPFSDGTLVIVFGEAHAILPCTCSGHLSELAAAVADTVAGGGAERNDRFAGEVVAFDKAVDRPCRLAPPERIAEQDSVIAFPIGNLDRGELGVL